MCWVKQVNLIVQKIVNFPRQNTNRAANGVAADDDENKNDEDVLL